jgi:tight adherence protein B
MIFGIALFRPLYDVAMQAGYHEKLPQLLLRMGIYALLGLALLLGLHVNVIAIILVPPLAYMFTYRHCTRILAKRNREFIDQFPDALEIIVRSVRSGFPFSVALQMLAENSRDPIRSQFQQVVEEVALGRSLQQALARLAGRINEPDVRFFVVVIGVQQETGGNLAEIIGNLATIIRKRKQLRHKIKALTAEGKATGWVLGLLPVVVFVLLYVLQPHYLDPFFNDSLGQMLFGGAIFLLLVCFLIVRQMIKVDI